MSEGQDCILPSRHFLRSLRKLSRFRAERRFTSWWENFAFLNRMGKAGGKSESPSLDQVRLPAAVRSKLGKVFRHARLVGKSSPLSSNELQGRREAASVVGPRRRPSSQTVHQGNESGGERFLFSGVPSTKEIRWVETSDRPVPVKQVASSSHVSDGHVGESEGSAETRYVGNVHRSVRRLSSHSNSPRVQALSVFPGRRRTLQIPSSTVRSNVRPVAVHRGCETVEKMGCSQLSSTVSIPRRLAEPQHGSGNIRGVDPSASSSLLKVRPVSESHKVRADSSAEDSVSRREIGFGTRESFCSPISSRASAQVSGKGYGHGSYSAKLGRIPVRPSRSDIPDGSVGQVVRQKAATSGNPYPEEREEAFSQSASATQGTRTAKFLASGRDLVEGYALPAPASAVDSVHRRVPRRMGGSLRGSDATREVGYTQAPYQLPGTEGCADSSATVPIQMQEQNSAISRRQYDSGSLCQQVRRHSVISPDGADVEGRPTSSKLAVWSDSSAHHRQVKRVGRSSIACRASGPIRMEAIPRGFHLDVQSVGVGQSRLGTVRQQPQQTSTKVCVPVPGSSSVGSRCPTLSSPRGSSVVRFSSGVSDQAISHKIAGVGQFQSSTSGAVVRPGSLDTDPALVTSGKNVDVSPVSGPVTSATLGTYVSETASSEPQDAMFGEERLKRLGFSEQVVKRLLLSHAASTTKQYKSKWSLFLGWSAEQSPSIDPTSPSLTALADFMTWLFQSRGLVAGSINNYRSAIAFYWKRLYDFDVPSDDQVLRDLMKSFVRDSTRPKKRVISWDLKLVLEFFRSGRFSSWEGLSAKDLTLKSVFLIALASGKRRGELHALTREGVKVCHGENEGMLLHPSSSFISKTQMRTRGLGALKPVFIKKLFSDSDPLGLLCPVTCLQHYLDASAVYRASGQKQLFVSWQENASRDIKPVTISGYIKKAILLAYEGASNEILTDLQVVPHTVRHVASSLSAVKHFSMEEILRSGSWSTPNTFISHYLHDYSTDTLAGLSSLGGFVAGGTTV